MLRLLHAAASKLPVRIINKDADTPLLYRYKLLYSKPLSIYLHRFVASDKPHYHNHPWWFGSVVLSGHYIEHAPDKAPKTRKALSIALHSPSFLHRIEVIDTECWTLFVRGFDSDDWSFHKTDGTRSTPDLSNGKSWLNQRTQ